MISEKREVTCHHPLCSESYWDSENKLVTLIMEDSTVITAPTIEEAQDKLSKYEADSWLSFPNDVNGYYIDSCSCIHSTKNMIKVANLSNKNTFPTLQEAEACIALAQLLQWRDCFNGCTLTELLNEDEGEPLNCVIISGCDVYRTEQSSRVNLLTFRTAESAAEFVFRFKSLILKAAPLIGYYI